MNAVTRSFSRGEAGETAERHTRRDYVPDSADPSLAERNIELIHTGSYRGSVAEILEPAIERYNARQKRPCRRKDPAAYVDDLFKKSGNNGNTVPVLEYVVQLGNRSSILSVTDDGFEGDEWSRLKQEDPAEASAYVAAHLNDSPEAADARRRAEAFYTRFTEEFQKRFPHAHVIEAIIHADEPKGTPHLNLSIAMVGGGEGSGSYKTGIDTRISQKQALKDMGYAKSVGIGEDGEPFEILPLTQWQNDARSLMEELMPEYGFELQDGDSKGRSRQTTRQFVSGKELAAREAGARAAQARLVAADEAYGIITAERDKAAEEVGRLRREVEAATSELEKARHTLRLYGDPDFQEELHKLERGFRLRNALEVPLDADYVSNGRYFDEKPRERSGGKLYGLRYSADRLAIVSGDLVSNDKTKLYLPRDEPVRVKEFDGPMSDESPLIVAKGIAEMCREAKLEADRRRSMPLADPRRLSALKEAVAQAGAVYEPGAGD